MGFIPSDIISQLFGAATRPCPYCGIWPDIPCILHRSAMLTESGRDGQALMSEGGRDVQVDRKQRETELVRRRKPSESGLGNPHGNGGATEHPGAQGSGIRAPDSSGARVGHHRRSDLRTRLDPQAP